MSFHLKTTKAIFARKIMVGFVFFVFSVLALNGLAHLGLFFFPPEIRYSVYVFLGIIAASAAIGVKPADHAVKRVLRDYVLRQECYAHISLLDLVEELQSILNLREMGNLVVNSFAEAFHLKTVTFFVARQETDSFEVVSAYGWAAPDLRRARLSMHSMLAEVLRKNGEHTLIRNSLLKTVSWQDASNLELDFNTIRAGWILPLFFKGELLGFMAFNAESPERIFEKADFEFFIRFSRKVAVCLRNAREVEVLVNQNIELQDAQAQRFQNSKLRAISQLAEGLAHEIHNPLAIISGKAQVLLFKQESEDWAKRVKEALEIIIQQSKRAADITRKVLAFVRESQASAQEVDLPKTAREVAELLQYQAVLKQIEVIVEADEGLPLIYAQPGDMREIFSGLILNSVEVLESHGWVRVAIRSLAGEEAVEIIVTDSSRGVLPEAIEQIFDPFYKTRHEALGLGLFAVKQIVHRYGGNIRAESREGEGVLFQIRLPLTRLVERVNPDQEGIIESASLSKKS